MTVKLTIDCSVKFRCSLTSFPEVALISKKGEEKVQIFQITSIDEFLKSANLRYFPSPVLVDSRTVSR